jgi:tRNA A-37 threonylcarbamoyl transferase component Bud32
MPEPVAPSNSGAAAETGGFADETLVAPPSGDAPLRYGDFEVIDRLGAGAMGIVYRARQLLNDRPTKKIVALKVLKPELSNEPSFEERFFREAEHALNLHHPNIVEGLHAKKENGLCFMAMEFIDGETLTGLVERDGPLPIGDALRITLEVARGLQHAHDNGVFHRDIKPGNVMVSRAGQVKVTDLGLAKAPAADAEITHHGQLVGTPVFMAPEQSDTADEPDARFDVYALGGTLFYLLTGQSPFSGSSIAEILNQKRRPPSVRAVRNDAPIAVDILVRRMLALNPAERLQSMRDVIEAIRETGNANERLSWAEGEDGGSARRQRGFLDRHGKTIAIAGVASVIGIAALWALREALEGTSPPVVPTPALERPSAATPPLPTALPSTPSIRADVFIARAMSLAAQGKQEEARRALEEGRDSHPDDERLRSLSAEAGTGVLPLVQYKNDDGSVAAAVHLPAADGIVLPSGTELRIGVALARTCYVYVFDRDSVPKVDMLFPDARLSALRNPLQPGLHWIPDRDERADLDRWLRLDNAKGEDNVYVVAVTRPLKDPAKVMADIRDDPDQLRRALDHDPDAILAPGDSPASCFATSPWSSFSFEHR